MGSVRALACIDRRPAGQTHHGDTEDTEEGKMGKAENKAEMGISGFSFLVSAFCFLLSDFQE